MNGLWFVVSGTRVGQVLGRVHGSADVYQVRWQDEPGNRLLTLGDLLELHPMLFKDKDDATEHSGHCPPSPVTIEVPTSRN